MRSWLLSFLLILPIGLGGAALAIDEIDLKTMYDHEGFGPAERAPDDKIFQPAWEAVVRIRTQPRPMFMSPDSKGAAGAGFVVHSNGRHVYVLTARHNIPCSHPAQCETFHESKERGEIVSVDDARDVALIKFQRSKHFSPQVIEFSTENPKTSEPVVAFGYPDLSLRKTWKRIPQDPELPGKRFSSGVVISHQKNYPFENATQKGNGQKIDPKGGKTAGAVLHSADYLRGMSGGPLLNSRGQVIGMNNTAIAMRAADHQYCVGLRLDCVQLSLDAKEMIKFLEKHLREFRSPARPRSAPLPPAATPRGRSGL